MFRESMVKLACAFSLSSTIVNTNTKEKKIKPKIGKDGLKKKWKRIAEDEVENNTRLNASTCAAKLR